MNIGVIDYGAGNLRSVCNAIHAIGMQTRVVSHADALDPGLTHLVLPGVGSFGDCMAELDARALTAPLRAWLTAGRPYFGICLGYQILFEGSEESPGVPGLGAFPGHVQRFPASAGKIPHMGWNSADPTQPLDPAWHGLDLPPFFYFVHSYFPVPADPAIIAAHTTYGTTFASMVRHQQTFATQFHPEKSQHAGLQLLRNFLTTTR